MTETGLVWLVSSSGISTDRDIDQDIGSLIRISIDQESSGIFTCQEIDREKNREIDQKILIEKGLVLMASAFGFDRKIVTIKLYNCLIYYS